MHTVTFYSFKGGVGRTFALVNVGLALAQAGRRVLLVDFDLEAPGLHTFNLLKPSRPHLGIVDYVSQYSASNSAPDVTGFLYEAAGAVRDPGKLWVMPAGTCDATYRERLSAIDWRELYTARHGYLMIEDLKQQWKVNLRPDYVLIDSRTGHSDVEGVCTRHMPDAVVAVFAPNVQNLDGIAEVVSGIRSEASFRRSSEKQPIVIHFVMSNVPDLDDEDEILTQRVMEFCSALQLSRDNILTIHSYPSLNLLNQDIFVDTRPRSRLAKEYVSLKNAIIEHNHEDVEGALRFLEDVRVNLDSKPAVDQDRLAAVEQYHKGNVPILVRIARIRAERGEIDDAIKLLDKAVAEGDNEGIAYLHRAILRRQSGDEAGAKADLLQVLTDSRSAKTTDLVRAIRLASIILPDTGQDVAQFPAIRRLGPNERLEIALALCEGEAGFSGATDIIQSISEEREKAVVRERLAQGKFVLTLIGVGEFETAMKVIAREDPVEMMASIQDAFNYGMAAWGATGRPLTEIHAHVIELARSQEHRDANFEQCLAVSSWVVGNPEDANQHLHAAVKKIAESKGAFSCWRYRYVSPSGFLADCAEIAHLIETNQGRPKFIKRSNLESSSDDQ
jgi:MinD-like ATPase involved in chromosome partitioning or flagellar assembly